MTQPTPRDLYLQACRQDFPAFLQACFPILHGGKPLPLAWANEATCHALGRVVEGHDRRLIITQPPRSLKSITSSVMLAAYILGKNPAARIMCVSYSATLASQHSADFRRLVQSPPYKEIFPGTRLDRVTEEVITTDQRGERRATTIGGTVTGLGADYIIIDDPISAQDAHTESGREAVKRFYDTVLSSRLNDPATGAIILVMQRLHEDDLAGHLLRRGGWKLLKLEAIATEDQLVVLGGGRMHQVRAGDLLAPNRLTRAYLDEKILEMGSRDFQAQYQQAPAPAQGNIVQRGWLQYYKTPPPRDRGQVILSLDTATKTDAAHDYSACTVWLKIDEMNYLIDVWRRKVKFPELKDEVIDLCQFHRADRLIVEDNGNGTALIQYLRQSSINVIPFKSTVSKESRLTTASASIEAGKMLLPEEAPWVAEFERELLGFPNARHDDQVDSLSQYFMWVRNTFPAFKADFWHDEPPNPSSYPSAHGIHHDHIADTILGMRWR